MADSEHDCRLLLKRSSYVQFFDGMRFAWGAPMGFDIFCHCYRNGENHRYKRKTATDIFDRGALRPSDLEYVEYLDGRGEIYAGSDDGDTIDGFMLAHFGGQTICERLLEIAAVTQSLICWPSTGILFGVTDLAHIAHLPEDVRDKHYVALVRNVDELWAAINAEEAPPDPRPET